MESILGLVRHSGNDGLLKSMEMSLLAAQSGHPLHLHAEGLRGTGKTTAMRAVRRALPRIRRIKGCLYNCDPAAPHCPHHRNLSAEQVEALGDELVPMPFLEISHSAKVGSVVGSIDLGRLVSPTQPEAALLPGTIPQAHRGIIFVDEVNRLAETAPELADVLLDVMGTKPGRVQIEETGLPAVELPVQVTVWAASNPDEDPGPLEEIRRQLSDRFDFVVYTDRPGDAAVVEQILAAGDEGQVRRPHPSPVEEARVEAFRALLASRAAVLRSVQLSPAVRQAVADLYSRFSLESLRAVQAMQAGMRLAACLDGRSEPTLEDLARVVPLALRHRVDPETMKKITGHLTSLGPRGELPAAPPVPPVSRPRFPNISFGAAAVQPLPEPPGAPEPEMPAAPGRRDGDGTGPQRPGNWLDRALNGLRRNLGFGAGRPEERGTRSQSPAAVHPRPTYTGPQQPGLTAPRAGRLYQQAEQQQGAASGPGGRGAGPGSPAGRTAGTSPQPAIQAVDPLKCPPSAPPNRARPLSLLSLEELIRTEEELGGK